MAKHIVYFLGAGCSYNFGYPLTGDIMPEILHNLYNDDLFQIDDNEKSATEKKHEELLTKYLFMMYPGLENKNPKKEKAAIPNITEVLSLVDHCCFYNIPPHPEINEDNLLLFRQLLNRAVGELLLDYELSPYTVQEQTLLSEFIRALKNTAKNVTVITTNYDLSIDREFKDEMKNDKVNYGISYRKVDNSHVVWPPADPVLNYYKLHGSLNWMKCDLCGYYYINPKGSIIHNAFKETPSLSNTCICSGVLRLKSVLITPSLVRDIRDSNLLQIWKASMEAIRTADELVFIGYSLPAEDLAIKSVIMRGLNGRDKNQRLATKVIQYGDAAKNNYENLFGKKMTYYADGLADYMKKYSI